MISRFLLFLSVVFLGIGQIWGQTWTKLTNHNDVTSSGTYLIVDTDSETALTSANGSGTAPAAIDISSSLSNDLSTITGAMADNLQWKFETSGSGHIIRPISDLSVALTATNTNNGVRITSSSSNVWTLGIVAGTYKGFQIPSVNGRYIGVYLVQDWRTYTSTTGNISTTNIEIYELEVSTDPTLTTNPASMSGFNYVLGSGPSSTQQLTLTGSNLEDDELVELTVLDNNFEIATSAAGPYSDFIENIELSPTSNTATIYVRLKAGLSVGNYEDEIGIESTLLEDPIYVPLSGAVNAPTPTTTLSVSSLSGFTYVYENGPSTSQNFTVEGSNLTSDITVTAPTNYQVSLSSGTGYQNALTLTPVSGTVNTTTIYIRLNAGLAPNNYNGNITIATAGITNKSVALTGSVTCGVITNFPFTETFDDSSPSRACWSQIQEDGSANWTYAEGSSGGNITTAQEGSLNARFVGQSGNHVTKLVSPVMDISGVTNPTVSFYYGQQDWFSDQNELKVYYRTSTSNDWVVIAHYTGNISSWTEEQLALPTPSATYQIAFEGINNWGHANVLDNVRVHSMVACEAPVSQPTNLVFSGITNNSISGSFTATTADKYLVIRSTSSTLSNNPVNGVVYTAGQTLGNGTIVQSSSATTFTANGLTPNTEYFFFVFSFNDTDCGGGPAYNITSPLTDSETTLEGPCYTGHAPTFTASGYTTVGDIDNGGLPTSTIRLASGGEGGSVSTTATGVTAGDVTIRFRAKGWSATENQVTIQVGSQSVLYTNLETSFEWHEVTFTNVPANPILTFSTIQNKRLHLGNVEINCGTPTEIDTYFRSQANGDWTSTATWESSTDGLSWADATTFPGATAESVVIQTGNTVNINNSSITLTNTEVFGAIQVLNSNYGVDGDEDIELTIKPDGEFIVNGSGYKSSGSSYGLIETGGKVIARNIPNETGAGSDFVNRYLKASDGLFHFADGGICEWDCTTTTLGTQGFLTIFEPYETGDIAILRFTSAPPSFYTMGTNANNTVFNAVLEVTDDIEINISGSGTKTFVGGIRGEGIIDVYTESGNINLGLASSVVPELGGNILLRVPTDKLKLPNGANVSTGANFVIERSDNNLENGIIDRQGGTINIDGTLDITNMRVNNSANGSIILNDGGKIRTRHTGGLFGAGTAIIDYESSKLVMNEGSTAEYYGTSSQTVSNGLEYSNLEITGTGQKTGAAGNIIVNQITKLNDGAKLHILETADSVDPNVLTAKGGINVSSVAGTELLFENNAILMQDEDAVNIGDITVERFVQDMNNVLPDHMDYVYWSSPVTGQGIHDGTNSIFSPGTPKNRNYQYHEPTDYFVPTPDQTFTPGKGYAIRAEISPEFPAQNLGDPGYDKTYTFTGIPNNGLVSIPIQKSPDNPEGVEHGYNLVGNPYPSNIDADVLFDLNETQIEPVIYLWTNNITQPYQPGSSYNGESYATYNRVGGVSAGEKADSAGSGWSMNEDPDGIIKVGQGFIIKAREEADSLRFQNMVGTTPLRITDKGTDKGFFFQKNLSQKDRFWLEQKSPLGMINSTLVGYVLGATNEFEKDYDAPMLTETSDAIYTVIDSIKLRIQGRSFPLELTDVVPLGLNHFEAGVYTIGIRKVDGIFNQQSIYLRDKQKEIVHNLSLDGEYVYETNAGELTDRFEIIFQEDEVMSTSDLLDNSIKIYHTDQNIVIESEKEKILSVEVYDLNGRKVHSKDRINSSLYQIRKTSLATQVFVVKVLTDGGKVETRKIINQ